MKTWQILRDCRLEGDGVHHAVPGIACLHNLGLDGSASRQLSEQPAPTDSWIICGTARGPAPAG